MTTEISVMYGSEKVNAGSHQRRCPSIKPALGECLSLRRLVIYADCPDFRELTPQNVKGGPGGGGGGGEGGL